MVSENKMHQLWLQESSFVAWWRWSYWKWISNNNKTKKSDKWMNKKHKLRKFRNKKKSRKFVFHIGKKNNTKKYSSFWRCYNQMSNFYLRWMHDMKTFEWNIEKPIKMELHCKKNIIKYIDFFIHLTPVQNDSITIQNFFPYLRHSANVRYGC